MGGEAKVDGCDIFLLIISVFLPPLGVFLEIGCHVHFWINLVLSLLFYIPGTIYLFTLKRPLRES